VRKLKLTALLTNPVLNSSFVIFFLSSVVIALVTFCYSQWVANRESAETVRRINLEVTLRLHTMTRLSCDRNRFNLGTLVLLRDVFYGSTSDPFVPQPSYAEFDNRSMSDLLWQSFNLGSGSKNLKADIGEAGALESLIPQAILRTLPESSVGPECRGLNVTTLLLAKTCVLPREEGQSDIYNRIRTMSNEPAWGSNRISVDKVTKCPLSLEPQEATESWWASVEQRFMQFIHR
jgi:hypothetical protein